MTGTLFWNVDTQRDFMERSGKYTGTLYIPGSELIAPNLERITAIAADKGIKVVNTADWHNLKTREIRTGQFPPHCMEGSYGAQFIDATAPADPYTISWKDKGFDAAQVMKHRNIVLYKDEFDAFHPTGAPHTKAVLELLDPSRVIVYGVATDYCVNDAVKGLLDYAGKTGASVYVVKDAIKEIAPEAVQQVMDTWAARGARFTATADLERMVKQ